MNMVYCPRDAAVGLASRPVDEAWTSHMTMPQTVAPARSRFESLALRAGKMPPEGGDMLGVLLAATFPLQGRGCRVLRPLWTEEAMHRAYSFVRLADARNRSNTAETIACDLAACFRNLTSGGERDLQSCGSVLRTVATGLGALFGEPENITVEAKIEDVWLPAYKRRALVLAASELVSNALLHGFRGRHAGQIEVSLTALGATAACLHVADNGNGFIEALPNLDFGVGAGLAGLLEADLVYDRMAGWTIAEIEFPLSGS